MVNLLFWGLAILFYGVGDVILTFVAVQYETIEEASPVTKKLLGANPTLIGLVILKVAAFSVLVDAEHTLQDGTRIRLFAVESSESPAGVNYRFQYYDPDTGDSLLRYDKARVPTHSAGRHHRHE